MIVRLLFVFFYYAIALMLKLLLLIDQVLKLIIPISLYHQCFQIESGLLYSYKNSKVEPSSIPNLLLRYGLLDKLELRFSTDLLYSLEEIFSRSPFNFGTNCNL